MKRSFDEMSIAISIYLIVVPILIALMFYFSVE